jgi:hypothetical protein
MLGLGSEDVRQRLIDAWSTFCCADQRAAAGFAALNMRGRRVIVAFHRPGSQAFPGTTVRARAAIRSIRPHRVEPVYSGEVLVAYLVDDRG